MIDIYITSGYLVCVCITKWFDWNYKFIYFHSSNSLSAQSLGRHTSLLRIIIIIFFWLFFHNRFSKFSHIPCRIENRDTYCYLYTHFSGMQQHITYQTTFELAVSNLFHDVSLYFERWKCRKNNRENEYDGYDMIWYTLHTSHICIIKYIT